MASVISRWPKRLTIAAALGIALVAVALGLFSAEILRELNALRASPRDNVQWSLAQLEVEILVLADAVHEAAADPEPDRLGEVRRRFDILYSRARMIANGDVFDAVAQHPPSARAIASIRRRIDGLVPLIDGPDAALAAGLPRIDGALEDMREEARRLVLDGVRLFAVASDEKRAAFARLLMQTAAIALVLIVLLGLFVLLLLRQKKVSMERAEALRLSARRFQATIEASLDAVIIADAEGRIVHFNPAAEKTFGYARAEAVSRPVNELVVPPKHRRAHEEGMARYRESGQRRIIGRGRVELEAMRAGGEEFPVELNLSEADGPDGKLLIAFVRDITERVRAERELTEARDKALAAAKAKSEYLAVMSHEMRTPLNGVLAVLDLLKDTPLEEDQRRYVETAIGSGELLQRHVDDVLDVNRLESGRLTLHPEPVDIAELFEEVVRIETPAAERRHNVLRIETDLAGSPVMGDRMRLSQLLLNLVGNAVKFTEGGTITLSARRDGEGLVEIAVADSGIGIAEGDRERIFEDFVTLDPSYTRAAGGYGLGLGICQRIVTGMGGQIRVESELARGSRFVIRLPLPPALADALAPSPAAAGESASETVAAAPSPATRRVLVVEDNETNRFAAREMLKRHGWIVSEAHDGLAGVAAAARERFDLILMDISMPRLDGLEATRRIRAGEGRSREAPIVALTAHALPEERCRVAEAGMQDLLIKPLRQKHLATLLDRLAAGTLVHGPPMADANGTQKQDDDRPDGDGGIDGARGAGPGAAGPPHDHVAASQDGAPSQDGAAAGVDEEILDASVPGELAAILGAAEFDRRLDAFLAEMRGLPKELAAIWRGGSLADVRERAHAANGSAALFGAVRLNDVLGTLEEACMDDEPDFVDPLIEELSRAVEETERAVAGARRAGLVPAGAAHASR